MSSPTPYHKAHWGLPIILISSLITIIFVVIVVSFLRAGSVIYWVVGWPVLALAALPFFSIFGYSVTPDAILIHRPFRKSRLPLEGLASIEVFPNAMRRSWRTGGNGGAFSFTGYFQNKSLGEFRAFATDLKRTVVLRYAHKRAFSTASYIDAGDETMIIVLSPSNPEAFVRDVQVALAALPQP
jgi:hypothetical protein